MSLVDTGANLTNKAFHSDIDGVLKRARAAGVDTIVVTGTSVPGSVAAADLAAKHDLYATAGVHPHNAKETAADFTDALGELLTLPRVVAIGECGLDYDRNFSPVQAQRACFEDQLQLAVQTGYPLFLHERAAHPDFLAMVRNQRSALCAAVVHCFTGSATELDAYLSLDLHIGITGWICDERRGLHLRELVGLIPANRLMLETDAPYLLPRNMPKPPLSRHNEPAFLPFVLDVVAASRRQPVQEVAAATSATARAFFRLD